MTGDSTPPTAWDFLPKILAIWIQILEFYWHSDCQATENEISAILWSNILHFHWTVWQNVRKHAVTYFLQSALFLCHFSNSAFFCEWMWKYRLAQKIGTISWYALTLSNINQFRNYVTVRIRNNNTITKNSTTPQVGLCLVKCQMS